jgi:hypothetical protein
VALNFNEGRVCHAVVRYLEHRESSAANDFRRPEREGHEYRVELTFQLNDRLFAMEHTGIEPFDGFMRLDAETARRVNRLVNRIAAKLPQTEEFTLVIPVEEFIRLKGKTLDLVQDALAQWVIETAPTLPVSESHRLARAPKISIPGVPFVVRLFRNEPIGLTSKFLLNFTVSDLEAKRAFRLKRALEKKCPKLKGWQSNYNARTILILEDNDIALTNQQFVADALLTSERGLATPADEVYLVKTSSKIWFIWPLRVGDKTYFDVMDPNKRCWEVDSTLLMDLTKCED